ncbi:MAG: 8-amino-7-oxononanoate synthase [Candidatus Omnitrophica bacterium]|nr:8-amino-7-oxononanoate synthase [Candidatus Omnitrophota bacterium]
MMKHSLQQELNGLIEKDLYRELRVLESRDPTRARFEGREMLLFCGNDYLGLSRHPRVVKAARDAFEKCGVGAGAARLISGTFPDHRKLEERIARFKRKEAAIVFATGFLANLGILTAFAGDEDVIIMDKLCHASLVDGARLSGAALRVFPHKNYRVCETLLKKHQTARRRILITEGVFSMDGDLADLETMIRMKEKYGAMLVVDDAHGTGVTGASGRGTTEPSGVAEGVDIVMGTLSKAIGGLGGFVAADRTLIDYLVNFSRPFIFATALPPALCAAAEEAFCLIEEEPDLRQKLWENIQAVEGELRKAGFCPASAASAILPVILGEEKKAIRAFEVLLSRGLYVPAVRYPTVPKGKARLRVTVSAAHTEQDIRELSDALTYIERQGF